MGKSAPEYATTTTDSGLWGSSTSSGKGTSYSAPDWAKNTMGTIGNNLNSTMNSMLSNNFSNDANFQAYQNQLNRTANQNYDASVLSSLANRGLMRSSGLQAATNSFNNRLIDNTTNLYDNYYNRLQNNLENMLGVSNNLFNYMTGLGSLSQNDSKNVSDYNLSAWQSKLNANTSLYKSLIDAAAKGG